jgi:hypothetical protein
LRYWICFLGLTASAVSAVGAAAVCGGRPHPCGRDATLVRFGPKEGGWTIYDIFDHVHRTAGISILYDSREGTFKQENVAIDGVRILAGSQLYDWLQSVLNKRRMVLVPVGPVGANGTRQWFAMDTPDPSPTWGPVYIHESEIGDYADHEGTYVVTTITLSCTADTTRMRNALAPISTTTGGVGRIQDFPGSGALIVGDYAPVVAEMAQRAAELDLEFAMKDFVAGRRSALKSPATSSGPRRGR